MSKVFELLGDRVGIISNEQIFTPLNIAQDAVDKLPEDIFKPSESFLDICCKSGAFLQAIYNRLMKSKFMKEKFFNSFDRHQHIINEQIFGISPTEECRMISIRTVCGTINVSNHIVCLDGDYLDIMRNIEGKRAILYKTMEKEFKRVKFNVVATNPPYNKGMDIDFINLAYNISTDYVVAITPAKWQTAEADQRIVSSMSYGQFRRELVPHMRHVCFYPDCLDVFGIAQADGISWYIIDKNNTYENKCTVENRCNLQKIINSKQVRDITNKQSLWNIGNDIVKYLGEYNRYNMSIVTEAKEFTLNINTQLRQSLSGAWDWQNSCIDKSKIGIGGYIFNQTQHNVNVIDKARCVRKGDKSSSKTSKDIFTSDDIDECKSFYSWIYSKFTRFFVLINISSLTILNNNTFRFVPAPPSGKFDHIYTDEELYKAFNLPQEYIDVIEAVIKERK